MEATAFGVMKIDATRRIVGFVEKPKDPPAMPGQPDRALASMGIYVFATKFLIDALRKDAADPNSSHDFGKDIIPAIVSHGRAVAHLFADSCVRSGSETEPYWRDAGTVDAFWEANIDLTDFIPALDLYDSEWPIWTYGEITPPAKFIHWFRAAASFPVRGSTSRCCSPVSGPTRMAVSPTWSRCLT